MTATEVKNCWDLGQVSDGLVANLPVFKEQKRWFKIPDELLRWI